MSEIIDPQEPKPRTRRAALETLKKTHETEIRATASEPLPDEEASGYHDVLVRSDRIELKHNTFVVSVATMVVVSLITFFVPLFNGLLGGVFGGFHARRMGRALAAAAVASVAVPAFLAFLYGFDTPDFLKLFYGLSFWGFAALHVLGLFIGALAGVYSRPLADRRGEREVTG